MTTNRFIKNSKRRQISKRHFGLYGLVSQSHASTGARTLIMAKNGMILSGLGVLLEEIDGFLVVQKVIHVCECMCTHHHTHTHNAYTCTHMHTYAHAATHQYECVSECCNASPVNRSLYRERYIVYTSLYDVSVSMFVSVFVFVFVLVSVPVSLLVHLCACVCASLCVCVCVCVCGG